MFNQRISKRYSEEDYDDDDDDEENWIARGPSSAPRGPSSAPRGSSSAPRGSSSRRHFLRRQSNESDKVFALVTIFIN